MMLRRKELVNPSFFQRGRGPVRAAIGTFLEVRHQAGHDQNLAATRAALGEKTFTAEFVKGQALGLELLPMRWSERRSE